MFTTSWVCSRGSNVERKLLLESKCFALLCNLSLGFPFLSRAFVGQNWTCRGLASSAPAPKLNSRSNFSFLKICESEFRIQNSDIRSEESELNSLTRWAPKQNLGSNFNGVATELSAQQFNTILTLIKDLPTHCQ